MQEKKNLPQLPSSLLFLLLYLCLGSDPRQAERLRYQTVFTSTCRSGELWHSWRAAQHVEMKTRACWSLCGHSVLRGFRQETAHLVISCIGVTCFSTAPPLYEASSRSWVTSLQQETQTRWAQTVTNSLFPSSLKETFDPFFKTDISFIISSFKNKIRQIRRQKLPFFHTFPHMIFITFPGFDLDKQQLQADSCLQHKISSKLILEAHFQLCSECDWSFLLCPQGDGECCVQAQMQVRKTSTQLCVWMVCVYMSHTHSPRYCVCWWLTSFSQQHRFWLIQLVQHERGCTL